MPNLNTISKIHLIGAEGIGVSAIGHYFSERGVIITGSDVHLIDTSILPKGEYWEGHNPSRIDPATDAIVYSPAVPETDPEREQGRRLGIKEYSYPQMLGEISKVFSTIAVSGTHGKSTTTSLLGLLFETSHLDPTVIVGAIVPEWKRNFRSGKSDILIVEACEYRAHMLNLHPKTIVLTNLELDHPDFFRDVEHVQEVFTTYIQKLSAEDTLIVNGDDVHISAILHKTKAQILRYGMSAAKLDLTASVLSSDENGQIFTLVWKGETLGTFTTLLPGRYNVMNILAAVATLLTHTVDLDAIAQVLKTFTGAGRRFEILGTKDGATIISDYAHHPTALRAVVAAAKERFPGKRILTVFRPHHQERTKKLYTDFVHTFENIDHLVLLEIYDVAGRESDKRISSQSFIDLMRSKTPAKDIRYAHDLQDAKRLITGSLHEFDVVLIVGAGDAYTLAKAVVSS